MEGGGLDSDPVAAQVGGRGEGGKARAQAPSISEQPSRRPTLASAPRTATASPWNRPRPGDRQEGSPTGPGFCCVKCDTVIVWRLLTEPGKTPWGPCGSETRTLPALEDTAPFPGSPGPWGRARLGLSLC